MSPDRSVGRGVPGVEQEKILGIQETVSKEACVANLNGVAARKVEEYYENLSNRRGIDKDKLLRVKNFFTSEDTLKRVVSLYSDLVSKEESITTEKQAFLMGHLSFVIERAVDQHLDNPEQYVSHGFDHSLRVIENVNQIMSDIPEVVQKVEDDYEITESEAKFLLRSVALFHDFGYPESESKQAGKTIHSVMGADIVNNGGVMVNGQSYSVKEVFLKILNSDRGGLMFRDFRDSILMHNADKVKQFFDGKLTTSEGSFLFKKEDILKAYSLVEDMGYKVLGISVCVDSQEAVNGVRMQMLNRLMRVKDIIDIPKIEVQKTSERYKGRGFGSRSQNKILGLEYTNVVLLDNPLKAIIRLADNMDMTSARLSDVQREWLFLAYNIALGDEKSAFFEENQEIETEFKKVIEGKRISGLRELIAKRISKREIDRLKSDLLARGNVEDIVKLVINDDLDSTKISKLKQFTQIHTDILGGYDVDECMAYWRKFIIDEIVSTPGTPMVDEETKMEVKKAVVKLDSLQLRHFGGCYAVKEVRLSKRGVEVEVKQDIFDELNEIRVSEEVKTATGLVSSIEMGVGEYQIRRLVEALRSFRIRDDSGLSIYVNNKVYFAA